MNHNQFELPNQRLPESKWTKAYYLEHANRMVQYTGNRTLTGRNETISHLYDAFNCVLSAKEEKANLAITKQYGHDLGVEYMIYPLAEMLVDQLVGEWIALPIRKKVYSMNKEAINEKLDTKLDMISEEIMRGIVKDIAPEVGFEPETANPEMELPDDVETFFSKSYKTNEEELGDDLIVLFLDVLKGRRTIKSLLQDYLIAEQCLAFMDEKNGHPFLRRCKYDESYTDWDPNDEIQRDPQIFAFYPYKTKNEILNEYVLTEDQKKKIDQIFQQMEQNNLVDHPFSFHKGSPDGRDPYQNCPQGVSYKDWYESTATHRLRTLKMMWISRKEVRAKVIVNKHTGKEEYKVLPKNYKERKRDNIKRTTIETIRYIEMLGPEICLEYGELKERYSYIDAPGKVMLPVSAIRGRNTMYSDEIRSPVAKVYRLQKLASDILFELRLSIKANNGRVLVYDVAQIPKQFLDTYGKKGAINRMLHHIKKDKILLFNSKDKNHRATFNQFTSLDLTNRGQVQDLINALMLIEDLAKKFVGLTPERQGESQKYQTATSIEKNIIGSNARTEIYFNPFDEFLQDVLNNFLLKAKHTYKRGKVFQLNFGDMMTKFLTITGKFLNVDLGIYIADRFKDKKDKEHIDQAAIQALGNAQDRELILDLINVLKADSASESQAILEKGLEAYSELQAQNAQAAQAEAEAQRAHEEKKMEHEKDIQGMKDANNIEVAQIYANQKNYSDEQDRIVKNLHKSADLEMAELKAEKDRMKAEKQPQE